MNLQDSNVAFLNLRWVIRAVERSRRLGLSDLQGALDDLGPAVHRGLEARGELVGPDVVGPDEPASVAIGDNPHLGGVVVGVDAASDDAVDDAPLGVIERNEPLVHDHAVGERDDPDIRICLAADDEALGHTEGAGREVADHVPHVRGGGGDGDLGTQECHDTSLATLPATVLNILASLSYPARTVRDVLSVTRLATRPDFTVSAVACREHNCGWSEAEMPHEHRLVLVRSGRFRRTSRHGPTDLDPTLGYLSHPGLEERFAHPAGGDVCTSISIAPARWAAMCRAAAHAYFYVDARVDLAHRRLLVAANTGDPDYALVEQLLGLLAATVGPLPAGPAPTADRTLVAAAREAILAEHPAAQGLFSLADHLGVSPYRLSRVFPREIGVSVTRYRNRVRVGRAMERLQQGERSLALLAADLGFADQAHLTRTMREHTGRTPAALRRVLAQTDSAAARSGLR
jgi:AraC-like DNA-binding protein